MAQSNATTIQSKVALVTGGSKGIGFAVAEALVKEGVNVAITARTAAEVEAAAERLNQTGAGRALGLRCDVRDLKAQEQVVNSTVEEFGRLDLLVANAGVGTFGTVDALEANEWHRVIDTNLTGVFYSVKASVAVLKKHRGMIVTISSLAGKNPFRGGSAYNASKFGLNGFSEAIMLDLREQGVRVTTIMPGSVATYFGGSAPAPADDWKIQPEDIGAMVVYLFSVPERTLPSRIEVRPSFPRKG